jgi:hypothetical protein
MRDVLVRPHYDHAAALSLDTAHGKDVMAILEVGTEHLFVVEKPVTSFPGQKECGHSLKDDIAMMFLEDRAHVDH